MAETCVDCGCDTTVDVPSECERRGCANTFEQCLGCWDNGTDTTTRQCPSHFPRPSAPAASTASAVPVASVVSPPTAKTCIDCGGSTVGIVLTTCTFYKCGCRFEQCQECWDNGTHDTTRRCGTHWLRPAIPTAPPVATLKRKLDDVTKELEAYERAAKSRAVAAPAAPVVPAAPERFAGPTAGDGEWWGVQYYCGECKHDRWFKFAPNDYAGIWTAKSFTCHAYASHLLKRPDDLRRICLCTGDVDGRKTIKLTILPEGCNKEAI